MTEEQYERLPQLFKEIVDLDRKMEEFRKKDYYTFRKDFEEWEEMKKLRQTLQTAAQKQYGHSIRNDGSANRSE
jgi:hypothetical protein